MKASMRGKKVRNRGGEQIKKVWWGVWGEGEMDTPTVKVG